MSYTRNKWWEEQAPNLYSCWIDGESKSLHKSWRKWARTPPTRAKNGKNTELGWAILSRIGLGWWLQPGQNSLNPLSPSSSPIRAIQLSVLTVLGSSGGSSCPFPPRFVKTLWFPVHSTVVKIRSLFLSSFISCVVHFFWFRNREMGGF